MQTPILSVLICTFNRKNLLKNAINSVLNQGFKDLEIIISDDGSNDGTAEFCENLCKENSRIFYIKNSKYKKGPNGNKNNALDAAKAQWIMFLDDDDELLEGAIEILFSKSKNYSHILANCVIKRGENLTQTLSGRGFESDCEVSKKDFLLGKMSGEFLSIFKRNLLGNLRFNDEIWGHEALLWVNLYKEKSFYIHKPLRIYRANAQDSVTAAASLNAKGVYLGYLELAHLLEAEFSIDKDPAYAKKIAYYYKMAAYYAKFAKMRKEMFANLAKSLRTKPSKEALMLLCVCFMPLKVLKILSLVRVKLCKN